MERTHAALGCTKIAAKFAAAVAIGWLSIACSASDDGSGGSAGGGAAGAGGAGSVCQTVCAAWAAPACPAWWFADVAACVTDCEKQRTVCADEYDAMIVCEVVEPVTCDPGGDPGYSGDCDAENTAWWDCKSAHP